MAPPPSPKPSKQTSLEVYNLSCHEVAIVDPLNEQSASVCSRSHAIVSVRKRVFASPRLNLLGGDQWSIPIKLRMSCRGPPSTWCRINAPSSVRSLVVYYTKISKKLKRIVILTERDLSCFMRDLSDQTHLSEVVIPGTHDSVSFYGWPFAQCQNPSNRLLRQLENGVRFVDVRLSVINNVLISFHGPIKQHTLFTDIVDTLYTFLRSERGKDECVVMSIKQEDFTKTPPVVFSGLVRDIVYHRGDGDVNGEPSLEDGQRGKAVSKSLKNRSAHSTSKDQQQPIPNPESQSRKSKDMWWLHNRVPTLGEVRGKIILFSRFGEDGTGWDGGLDGLGIHPTSWPNSRKEGFEWACNDTTIKMHDWYDIGTFLKTPEKFTLASDVLKMPSTPATVLDATLTDTNAFPNPFPQPKQYVLPLSYTSASSIPFALPPTVACGIGIWRWGYAGVNARLGRWILDHMAGRQLQQPPSEDVDKKVGEKDSLREIDAQTDSIGLIRGWVLMDYLDEPPGVARLLVELNFFA